MAEHQKWEYKMENVGSWVDTEKLLCCAGDKGWELVAVANGWLYLKRPAQEGKDG